jgi:HAMP domain-containing protein
MIPAELTDSGKDSTVSGFINDKDSRPRRNLKSTVIEPFKQIKFGLYVIGISVAFVGICAFMFVSAFTEQYQHVMGIFNVVDPNLKWELVTNDVFKTNAMKIGILFAAFIVVLFFVVFKLTHRYYGPLVSIERFVDEFARGDYSKRAKIREKDELHSLVEKLNLMADQIERRHGSGPAKDKADKAAS